jgi:hypothetical protein
MRAQSGSCMEIAHSLNPWVRLCVEPVSAAPKAGTWPGLPATGVPVG